MSTNAQSPEVKILPNTAALNRAAVDEISRCARESIAARGRFSIVLSGGNTPKPVYSLLAEDQKDPAKRLPWEKIFVFFGDERHVPPTDSESNYRMAHESLLSRVPIPPQNVFRVQAELDAEAAASQCELQLQNFFGAKPPQWPRFDLVLLGIGPDGHTASLFPGSGALRENLRWVAPNWVEKLNTWRITFTYPVLNNAGEVMFIVAEAGKAQILRDILKGEDQDAYPAQGVRPASGRLLWLVEKSAAALL